jgi:hypothetical protein
MLTGVKENVIFFYFLKVTLLHVNNIIKLT